MISRIVLYCRRKYCNILQYQYIVAYLVWQHVFLNTPGDEVARLMLVSERTVYRYAEQYYCTGGIRSFIKRSGVPTILCDHELHLVLHFLLAQPEIISLNYKSEYLTALILRYTYQLYAEQSE